LRLALALELGAGFKNYLNRHLVKDLIFVHGVIGQVNHSLYGADTCGFVCPRMDGSRNFLNTAPVNENFVVGLVPGKLGKSVLLHPLEHLAQRFN
jgi:hypothetical protein